MSEIAALFTDFFRDLDVVPSDIIAGLVLLRKYQKQRMNHIISQGSNDVYQFLSGVPVTPQTRFLQLSQQDVMEDFHKVTHYMRFALAVYGWPVYVMMHPGTWCCRLLPLFRCCCSKKQKNVEIVDDNCCLCNYSTAFRIRGLHDFELVYCTYHVDIGETPFFVALDHVYKKVVVAIRGTTSLQDVLTDLKAEPETLPLTPPRDDWQGHKGMVQAAVYIKKKLINDGILQMAWDRDEERETFKYELVFVGHSLGAGTAAILAILLKPDYPNLHCYAYSPPGGLLTLPCVEETKHYITSVVVGKDCVPRIGLPQLEVLRADILNHIKNATDAKWKIISQGLMCCNRYSNEVPPGEIQTERDVTAHPSNSAIGLSAHLPLFPPGRMIHVVRSHPRDQRTTGIFANAEPIYQAIWANNGDFDEVLISPTMVNDHMPDNVLDALEKVVVRVAPEKPGHTMTEEERLEMLNNPSCSSLASPTASDTNNSHSHSQDDPHQRLQAYNNIRTSDGTEGGAHGNDILMEEMEQQIQYGTSASPLYRGQEPGIMGAESRIEVEEDMVIAPLASPETLSVASGLSAIGAFSPSSSLAGRDLLRASLQRCAQKQLDSPSEVEGETAEDGKKRLIDLARGTSSGTSKVQRSSLKKAGLNLDPEAGAGEILDSGEDYTVRLRSGNTICVKAEVVNELARQGKRLGDIPSTVQFKTDSSSPPEDEPAEAEEQRHLLAKENDSTAVLEPSSHVHVVSHSTPSRHVEENPNTQTNTNTSGNSPTPTDPTKPNPPTDISLMPSGCGENIKSPSPLTDYIRHSPLDQSNQHEYGHPNTYYTQAGVGYPTNAFHTPQRFLSFPSDDAKHLIDDLCQENCQDSEGQTSFVPSNNYINNFNMPEIETRMEESDSHALSTDPLIPRQQVPLSVEDNTVKTYHSTASQNLLKGKKVFKKAESDNCLIGGGKLSPRMRRSAEQDDIAHLCDALEIFESEEDKVRLCQSVTTLLDDGEDKSSLNADEIISNNLDGSGLGVCVPDTTPNPAETHITTSVLVPASGKRKTSSNQSVSFGGSVIIPAPEAATGHCSQNITDPNGLSGRDTESVSVANSGSIMKHSHADFFLGDSVNEKQEIHTSLSQSLTGSETSSVSASSQLSAKQPVQQITANSLVDILNDRDNASAMVQETHL
ncbi:Sn1-specific diacylglycerol lipase alpha [Elysia marginata]|uniref:sn-1-specific diacylglycerol lipase n=1 Tax=Elysia marginata TaxID=1093978 RepID=A0AAV4ITT5_9GAST|nr:Sn1-specific diacylglycerol lipase alpha [Elysia marginata]